MTGQTPKPDTAELEQLAEDWITLWQSEIAAMAADREAAEGWAAAVSAWAAMGAAWLRAVSAPPFGRSSSGGMPPWPIFGFAPEGFAPQGFAPQGYTPQGGTHDGPAAPPRPAPAAAAPDGGSEPRVAGAGRRDDGSHGASNGAPNRALLDRLAELERRLADIEGGSGGAAKDPGRPRRRRPRA